MNGSMKRNEAEMKKISNNEKICVNECNENERNIRNENEVKIIKRNMKKK